jgi:UDP-2,3-diacylglucosamine pyrophosphatase LpxH
VATSLTKIKKERPFVDKVKPFTSYMRWALIHDTAFAIKTGIFIFLSFLRMAFLQMRHPLLDFRLNWARLKGVTIYPSFTGFARKVLRENAGIHTVIFGHTHVLQYKQWSGGREYFNIGTWNEVTSLEMADFGLQKKLTYAFIEQISANKRPRTRLREWRGHWDTLVDATNMPGR